MSAGTAVAVVLERSQAASIVEALVGARVRCIEELEAITEDREGTLGDYARVYAERNRWTEVINTMKEAMKRCE